MTKTRAFHPSTQHSTNPECSPSAEEAGAKPRPSTQSKCSSERMSSWPVPRLLLWTLLGGWKTWIVLKFFWSFDESFCCFAFGVVADGCFPKTHIIRCSWRTCLSHQHAKACHGQWISVPKSVELTGNTLPKRCHGHHWIPNLQILHRQHPKQPCQHRWMRCTICGSEVKKAPTRYDKVWCPTKIVPGFHHCSSFVVHPLLPWIKVDPVLHALPSAVAPHNGTGWKARPWRIDGYCFPSQVHQNEKESAGLKVSPDSGHESEDGRELKSTSSAEHLILRLCHSHLLLCHLALAKVELVGGAALLGGPDRGMTWGDVQSLFRYTHPDKMQARFAGSFNRSSDATSTIMHSSGQRLLYNWSLMTEDFPTPGVASS